ncbi:MAG: hypothetical protein JWL61_2124 [Gemmatimonadetes bacterium]|nr:hypothetical protein [Gemmatimonadota bacterium]
MSADLQNAVAEALQESLPGIVELKKTPSLWMYGSSLLNVRTASEKSGAKFWFDVTPRLYESESVDFFLFACGDAEHIYIFPRTALEPMVRAASLGGAKQVPQFTLFTDTNEFEPAGAARYSITAYLNAFNLLPSASVPTAVDRNAGITVGDLVRQLSGFPQDAELYMGGLHFYRLKNRSDHLVQLEFQEQVYRDSSGQLFAEDLIQR